MSLGEFQRALSDLVMSPAFRDRVAAAPAAALAPFDLTARERARLQRVARDSGVKAGTLIHRSFRLSMLSNTLPRTCKVLGPEGLRDVVHAYWQENPPRTLFYVREARRFGDFALDRFRRGVFVNDFLPELLEAELDILLLSRLDPSVPAMVPVELPVEPPGDLAAAVPRLHPRCRVVRFRRDPEVVLAETGAGRIPGELPAGEHYLLLATAGGGDVLLRPIPVEWGRALLACDGETAVAALAADDRFAGEPPFTDVARELAAEGYLVFAPAAVAAP
jgi:hypothetical protein